MDPAHPYLPEGTYTIPDAQETAEVYSVSYQYLDELRVRRLPEDEEHGPLNELLAHVSVLELDHLALAAALGEPFVVEALDDILPRPGWEIETRAADDPTSYLLRMLGMDALHRGKRRDLLLLLELAARSALAPHQGQPAPVDWVRRLREAHPPLVQALDGAPLFARTLDH